MENQTAKHFVLQLGSLASLYLSLSFLLVLIFGLINIAIPDVGDSVWQANRAQEGIKIGIAMIMVFFPTYIALTRIVNQNRRKSSDHAYLGLTKWLIYLSLLVGGAVLLGDLVAVIMSFLEGDLTTRFVLKALAVLVIVGVAFEYYILDVRGYWLKNESKSKLFALIASVIVVVSLIAGFMQVESPKEAREAKIDQEQLSDLQDIQWRIQEYIAINEQLPESLDSIDGKIPTAPNERLDYVYEITAEGFNLCATFKTESTHDDYYYSRPYLEKGKTMTIVNPDNWEHGVGEVCFERVIKNLSSDA